MTSIGVIPIQTEDGLRLSALNPKYLHTNSTSHTWPFSAIAELIDNAYDPDVNASQLWIDLKTFKDTLALTFTDNGNGMMPDKLYKMLSFGFCEKVPIKGHLPVGHYGNGFKSGSMRLGKDALVFTKRPDTWSLGFLSQSYLAAMKSETIVVPIVIWDAKMFTMLNKDEGGELGLSAIMEYSVVSTEQQIKEEFRCIPGQWGTRIVIFNLRKTADNRTEFDFTSDPHDVRIPDDAANSDECRYKREQRQDHIPASDYSLRAYCSILYLKPKMQIILRGKKVKTCVIAKSLSKTEVDAYRPAGTAKPVKIVFGFSQNKNHYGIMMYHRNRLIKPYVRVGHQLKANILGVGVIGVIECDFLQPTHNKQDFDYTKAYRACMASLGQKLNEYWQEKKGPSKKTPQEEQESGYVANDDDEIEKIPDELWVQCDNPKCLKWRRLPDGANPTTLPDKWFCYDHPDPSFRSCEVPEEPYWEEEEILKPYKKEVKRKLYVEKEKEKEKEMRRMKEEKEKERKAAELAAKYDRELEAEKKKRLDSELKLKEHQEEIRRLQEQLKKEKEEKEILNTVASVPFSNIPSPSSTQSMLMDNCPPDLTMPDDLHSSSGMKSEITGSGRGPRPPHMQQSSPIGPPRQSGGSKSNMNKTSVPNSLNLQGGLGISDGLQTNNMSMSPHSGMPMSPPGGMSPLSPNMMPPTGAMNNRIPNSAYGGGLNSLPPPIQRMPQMNALATGPKPQLGGMGMPSVVSGVGQSLLGSPLNPAMTPPPMTPPGLPQQGNPSFMRNSKVDAQLAQIGVATSQKQGRAQKQPPTNPGVLNRQQSSTGRAPNKRPVTNDGENFPTKVIKKEEQSYGIASPGIPLVQSIPQNILKSIDDDIATELEAKPRDSLLSVLVKRSQQLRDLRTSVCKLLSVLVPDLNLPDLRGRPVDDDTIDDLLKQVLEANKEGN